MTLVLLCVFCTAAQAENASFAGLNDALKYLKKNQPESLTIESGKFKPSELIKVKNALTRIVNEGANGLICIVL